MNRKRILLADDHAEMLDEVRALLDQDYDIVGAVQDGKQLVDAARDLNPDLIISDISMPEMNGFEAAMKIRSLGIPAKLIFLTVQSSAGYLRKARALGAEIRCMEWDHHPTPHGGAVRHSGTCGHARGAQG